MKKLIYSSAISASVSIIAITVITIWAELTPGLKDFLKSLSGHHWVTKSLAVVILFPLVLGITYAFSRGETADSAVRRSLWTLIVSTVAGPIAILGFFLWHFL